MKVNLRNPEEHQWYKDSAFVKAETEFLHNQELMEWQSQNGQKPARIEVIILDKEEEEEEIKNYDRN